MNYEVPKTDLERIPPYILERVAENLRKEWPHLAELLKEAKEGDEIILTFVFKFKPVLRSYDEEGRVTQEFILIRGADEE